MQKSSNIAEAVQGAAKPEGDYDFTYYVNLPLTGYSAHVRGLSIKEENLIKSNTTTPKYTYETISRLIYGCTKFELDSSTETDGKVSKMPFVTYDDFMRNTPPADRDALLWGIIMKTYDEVEDVTMVCDNCKNVFESKFDIPGLMQIKKYTGKESIMGKEVTLNLMKDYNMIIHMKQPSLRDEFSAFTTNASNSTLAAAAEFMMISKIETEIVKELEIGAKKDKEKYIVTSPLEIYATIADKPAKLRKTIMKCWTENFGNYGVDVIFECKCPQCNNVIRQKVVPMNHLFQMVG